MTIPADTLGHRARMREAFQHRFAQVAPRLPAMTQAMAEACLHRRAGSPAVTILPASESGPALLVAINDDMPHLVDTLLLCLRRLPCRTGRLLHPVLPIKRDADGLALSMTGSRLDSVICVELLDNVPPQEVTDAVMAGMQSVSIAVHAEPAIRQKMSALSQVVPDSAWEIKAFISWLMEGHFLPLGLSIWTTGPGRAGEQTQSFGLTKAESLPELPPLAAQFLRRTETKAPLCITRLPRHSPIIRDSLYDAVLLRVDDETCTRLAVLIGLFDPPLASVAAREIPFLRRKVARTIELAGVIPLSHDEKHLRRIVEILPRESLFQDPPEAILARARAVLEREDSQAPCFWADSLPGDKLIAAQALIPRDRMRPDLENALRSLFEDLLGGQVLAQQVQLDEFSHARILMHVQGARPDKVPMERMEQAIGALLRSWDDELADELARHALSHGTVGERFLGAFPPSYQADHDASRAVADILLIEKALAAGRPVPRFDERGLTLFSPQAPVPLSTVLPVVEGLGLRSLAQTSHMLTPWNGQTVWIQVFSMQADPRLTQDPDLWRDITQVFEAVWTGTLESDPLNALVITARLNWREISLIRAMARYLRQVENSLSMPHMGRVLNRNGAFVRALADLFHARLDPASDQSEEEKTRMLHQCQAAIADGEDDRVADYFRLVTLAVLRTNFYQRGSDGFKDRLALKLDSRRLPFLPPPVPHVETWVYSPRVEGIHLRGGPVARGGLRWSDRPDDFRTEILGLLKAQRVKNAVIVPVGAKGGFVPRQLPADMGRDAVQAEALACYSTFIRGLLDITDSLRDGQVASPAATRSLDGPDPYLVVAADKGTATFSDTANTIAAEYDFWLGDAFASGGSAGYDHKAMGITARGAWVAVRRHFLEMGIDPDSQDITAVGIGDMSGDVFGNGMLLSRHIRLIAAFDHRHIFVDPDPDAARSWAERDRLFRLPRSSWADYDPSLLSAGGGIFDRSAKSITLSEPARLALGLRDATLSPTALIKAILRAPVDLLWFGGIGTYVKAQAESHADAGDKAADAIRIDAPALRAKVVGEGANLGMTQRARVEFARRGGRINTDAIDNSAGVDCSDHEVNIKILVGLALAEGRIKPEQRNALLAAMTDDVARLVLDDNHAQTRALTLMERQSIGALDDYMRLIRRLERECGLDRAIEFLPGDEALGERGVVGEGLHRPELAVILAYAKMWMYRELLETDLPEAAPAQSTLARYFPDAVWSVTRDLAHRHRLRREIIATGLTNQIIDHLGPLFVPKIMERSGASFSRVLGAVLAARSALNLDGLWSSLPPDLDQARLLSSVAGELEKLVVRLLARTDTLDEAISMLEQGRLEFLPEMETLLPEQPRALLADMRQSLIEDGLNPAQAQLAASLGWFSRYPDLVHVARSQQISIASAAAVHFRIGEACHLDLVRRAAEGIRARTQWHRLAASALIDDTDDLQTLITRAVLRDCADPDPVRWLKSRSSILAEIDRTVGEVAAGRDPDLAALIVVGRQIRGSLCR